MIIIVKKCFHIMKICSVSNASDIIARHLCSSPGVLSNKLSPASRARLFFRIPQPLIDIASEAC